MDYFTDIDYLTTVFDYNVEILPLPATEPYMQWVKRAGMYGYDRGQVDRVTGLIRLASTERDDMGVCYVATAKTLCKLAEIQGSGSYLYGAMTLGMFPARATRLDVRVDIADNGLSIYDLVKSVRDKTVKCSARRIYTYQGENDTEGCTVYFGSKKSNSYVRCYDKYAESNHDKPYSRIEVQLRRKDANRVWSILRDNYDDARSSDVIKQVVKSRIQSFGVPTIDAIFDESTALTFKVDDKPQSDLMKWLKTQVAPSFVRDIASNNGKAVLLNWFVDYIDGLTKTA